mmetsp:Transcript_4047/g.7797  ORF Transcript_4047/g.7797 Transcript_4047/m.7797 type:complete len:256 (-) Transcript_4047:212-979(-)|eukprot:CAMPEP_0175155012 /NCGR_PEP_ID=MMETSP0087-20121206/20709_1 /TAXON_ID=136419 /ORGANISM="Unknown Unknown, Strain D1" /LENGTH=255 /DNA_ID=CAMNT_0016442061 /DNA_START=15 /DNA_END=782 /DNA_ORIENTATION=-
MLFLLFLPSVLGTTGVDVSQAISVSEWNCLMSPGGQGPVKFAIPRVYQSFGRVDEGGVGSIKAAHSAGVPNVDGYIFPCVGCGNPGGQVADTVAAISGAGTHVGMLWYDIENYKWSSSKTSNQAFIKTLVDKGLSLGVKAGVYTNYYNWQSIVGLDYDYPSSKGLPVWYAHYDKSPSFSDFKAFGGWSKPAIKQYIGDATSCSVGVDYNFYPGTTSNITTANSTSSSSPSAYVHISQKIQIFTGEDGNFYQMVTE